MPDASSNGVCVRVSRMQPVAVRCARPAASRGCRPEPDRVLPLLNVNPVCCAEAHAELPAELVAGDHDARLDQHLPDRRVDLPDDLADLLELATAMSCTNRMFERGSTIATPRLRDDRALAARRRGLARPGAELLLPVRRDEVEQVLRLDVVELERLGHERLELADLRLRSRAAASP